MRGFFVRSSRVVSTLPTKERAYRLHGLAVQGKATFGRLVKGAFRGPGGVLLAGGEVQIPAQGPDLCSFPLGRPQLGPAPWAQSRQSIDPYGFHGTRSPLVCLLPVYVVREVGVKAEKRVGQPRLWRSRRQDPPGTLAWSTGDKSPYFITHSG